MATSKQKTASLGERECPGHARWTSANASQGDPVASSSEASNRRAHQPLNQQLPATAKWVASLPTEVQPLALLQAFPRVANALARLWQDDAGLNRYLDELLVDRRGGRRGFPPEIHNELLTLRAYRGGGYPGASSST